MCAGKNSMGISHEHFEPGEEVFHQGDLGDRLYNIARCHRPKPLCSTRARFHLQRLQRFINELVRWRYHTRFPRHANDRTVLRLQF